MERAVAIITARGGSKRIPRKNIKEFCGKPIILYSIEAALESKIFDEVMVSTDDEEIAEIARQAGAKVPFMRSEKASDDHATTADVILEVLESYQKSGEEFSHACCIYPTAPFVTAEKLKKAKNAGVLYALVGNIGHISLVKEFDLIPFGDFRLNIYNRDTRDFYSSLGLSDAVLSAELTLPMARDIGGGIITYGRIPLMITERCFIKENFGCERCANSELSDRKGAKFPLMREFGHRNLIFNSMKTYMGDKSREISEAGISHCHFIFSTESLKEATADIRAYFSGGDLSCSVRRVGRRQ